MRTRYPPARSPTHTHLTHSFARAYLTRKRLSLRTRKQTHAQSWGEEFRDDLALPNNASALDEVRGVDARVREREHGSGGISILLDVCIDEADVDVCVCVCVVMRDLASGGERVG